MADPVDEPDDDPAEQWKHDDPTERSIGQRRADEIRDQSVAAADTYHRMRTLADEITLNLGRNTWGPGRPLRYAA